MLKKMDNKTLNKSIDILRMVIMSAIFGVVILLFLFKLFELQIVKHEDYAAEVIPRTYRNHVIHTSRGHIYDRNGNVLASNVKSYNVVVDKSTIDSGDYNSALLSFIDFCNEHDLVLEDKLPVNNEYPYIFDDEYIFDADKEKKLNEFLEINLLKDENLTSADTSFYDYLCRRYDIPEDKSSDKNYRKLVGIRYDMETNSFGYFGTYTLLYDIDDNTRMLLSETLHTMHGISIVTEDKRYYNHSSLACHVLGRTGLLDASHVEEYVGEKGYSYDDIIGKEGAEKAFEDYLHGYNGLVRYEIDENNNVVGSEIVNEVKNGYSVKLTLDLDMQRAAEEALKEQIDLARRTGLSDYIAYNGEDCNAGSVVVMNPKNGDILVSASYPNYDLNTYSEDIAQLSTDEVNRPLVNRSMQGIYPPGSTFKIATAIAALAEGIVTPSTIINDTGRYTAYDDYQPACWSLTKRGYGHGWVDLKEAIEESCNYYFYKVADDMGIDALTKQASLLGLGQNTGVELPESTGVLASPEYRDGKGLLWNPGDTLQAAIGQSDNAFTPIQLCSYMSTVVNGGTRYKATLLESVENFYTNETVFENKPEIMSKIDLDPYTVEILKSAMKSVVDEGTASSVFIGYDYEIGGKTGTAQVSSGSDTVLFVGFAPYDDPEIVVSVVVEHGDQSSRATSVAKAVFDHYFASLEVHDENGEVND